MSAHHMEEIAITDSGDGVFDDYADYEAEAYDVGQPQVGRVDFIDGGVLEQRCVFS